MNQIMQIENKKNFRLRLGVSVVYFNRQSEKLIRPIRIGGGFAATSDKTTSDKREGLSSYRNVR